ncbi:ricin B lectin domain-containing protein [Zopfochytrium polystomum]|nr:ricin B lectin domain-containing protein [Zopfochytrium polystomum]
MLETSPEERTLVIWSGAPMTYTIVAVDTLQNSIETAAGIISLSIEGWRTGCNEQEGGFTSKITYTESASLASIWFKLQETTVCRDPSAIACAFFPSDYSRTTNTVLINYPRLVARTLERSVVAMTHELGHVLGLAHEINAQEAGIWYASAYDSSSIMLPSSLSLSAITENDCLAIKYYNDGFPEVRWCKVVRSGIGRCFNAKLAYAQPSLQSIRLRGNQKSTVVGHDELLLDSDEISCTGADPSLYTLIETDNINFLEGYVYPDFSLYECQGLTTSSSSNYIYVMQSDGNFVSYDLNTGAAIWSTNTGGQGDRGYSIVFQSDGNVVTSSNSGDIIWSSGTYGTSPLTFGLGGEKLYLQSSGHMSIVGGGGITLWSSRDEIVYQDIPLRMSRYGLCLVGAENVSAGLPQLYACNSTPDQMWTVTTLGEIISTQSGLCLMAYPDPLIGAPLVMLLPCDGESASRWNFLSIGEICNQRFRSCLGATPDNPSSGSELRVSPCSQQDGGAAQQGTTVQLWDYNGSVDQEWSFYTDGLISHKQSGLCLTDSELNSEVYAILTLERCTTTDNQRWSAQGGTFVNHWSGRCLDNYQSNSQAGNPVGAYPCNNEDSQQWSFE